MRCECSDASSVADDADSFTQQHISPRRSTKKWDNSPRSNDQSGRRRFDNDFILRDEILSPPSSDHGKTIKSYAFSCSSLLEEISPVLKQDPLFLEDIRNLNRLYESKFESLEAAYEESRTRLIMSALARNGKAVHVAISDQPASRPRRQRQRPHIGRLNAV